MRNGNFNWIISGYHADNSNNIEKWDKINAVMNDLNDAYKWPKLLYIDVNTDVEHKKFKEWEATLENRKWKIYKSNNWTRRGKGKQKNTNIDVKIYKNGGPKVCPKKDSFLITSWLHFGLLK